MKGKTPLGAKTMEQLNDLWSAVTTYGIAFLGMLGGTLSAELIVFWLGAILLVVRLLYEGLRLWRYWHTGEGGNG